MPIRRNLLLGAACGVAASPALVACSASSEHEQAARELRNLSGDAGGAAPTRMRQLLRYAMLAPSSHNTQCWKFRMTDAVIRIEADLARRCPVVDPDDHHLFVSLGCATENLAQAALAAGLQAHAQFDAAGSGAVAISLEPTKALASPLFQAITQRQCTRGDFDGQPVAAPELRLLEEAGTGNGVRVLLLTQRPAMERVLEFVQSGNTAQIEDAAFVRELKLWIRFSHAEALQSGDGLFAGASGNPALPRWLGSRLMDLVYTSKSENERYTRQVRNSAGIAVFVSDLSDHAHWVEAGRCYERFALQATALGIRNAMLNQAVEVAAVRPQFAAALGLGSLRPDLVVRFGRGPALPWSMRRPLEATMV
jgi:hypothetical protein